MPLGPLPYEVVEVEFTDSDSVDGYYVYSEVCELYGGDGLYGVAVVVSGNSFSDKLKRVLSFRDDIPDSSVVTEFRETTEDGLDDAMELEDELREAARKYIASET